MGKYLSVCQNFSARGCMGGAALPSVHGTPNISETTRARKLNLKIPLGLDMVKYPLYQTFSIRGI